MTAPTAELSTLVRNELRSILAEPSIRNSIMGANAFTLDDRDRLDILSDQVGTMIRDGSLGRVMSGPTWLDGVSVINGTITASKLSVTTLEAVTASTGTLNVTGSLTLAASFPATAARIVENSTGILGYNSGSTNTFALNVDGSGSLGVGGTAISWTTAGVVTIPAASISSLTIASVGSGTIGGTYQTGATNQHMKLSTAGISAWTDTAETNRTFFLNAATGAITIAGSFTVQSAATGAHITIDNAGGIAGYNATSEVAGNRTFLINAATGAGNLGLASSGITWDSSGNVSIPGSLLVGTINASTVTVSNLTATNIITGTLGTGGSGIKLGGTNGLTIDGNLTVGTGGKIKFGTSAADYLDNNLLHFEVSNVEESTIETRNGSNTPYGWVGGSADSTFAVQRMQAYYASGNATSLYAAATSTYDQGSVIVQFDANHYARFDGYAISTYAQAKLIGCGGSTNTETSITVLGSDTASTSNIDFIINNNRVGNWVGTNRALSLYGYLYPGTGSATQTGRYIYDTGSYVGVNGGLFVSAALYPGNQTTRSISDNGTQTTISSSLLVGSLLYVSNNTSAYYASTSTYLDLHTTTGTTPGAGAVGSFKLYLNGAGPYKVQYYADT